MVRWGLVGLLAAAGIGGGVGFTGLRQGVGCDAAKLFWAAVVPQPYITLRWRSIRGARGRGPTNTKCSKSANKRRSSELKDKGEMKKKLGKQLTIGK